MAEGQKKCANPCREDRINRWQLYFSARQRHSVYRAPQSYLDFGKVRLLRQKPRRKPSSAHGSFPSLILKATSRHKMPPCARAPPASVVSLSHIPPTPAHLPRKLREAPGGGSSWQRGKGKPCISLLKPPVLTGCQKLRKVLGMQKRTCSLAELLSTYLPLWLLRAQFWSKAHVQTNTQENHRRQQNTCKL